MGLSAKSCVPCKGGVEALSVADAQTMQRIETPSWRLIDGSTKLYRKFTFKNFKQPLAFVNEIGALAESENHHPDIIFGWGYVEVKIQTHKIGGLHENDFILATKIDQLVKK